jgi:hypothetical protein
MRISPLLRHRWLVLLALTALSAALLASAAPRSAVGAPTPPDQRVYLPFTAQRDDSPWNWQPAQAVTLTPAPRADPTLLLDAAGQAHLFWEAAASDGRVLLYHRFQTGSDWSAAAPLTTLPGEARLFLPPQVTPDGQIHLVWEQHLSADPPPADPYRLLAATYAAGAWSPPTELAHAAAPFGPGGLNVNPAGQLQLVYAPTAPPATAYIFRRRSVTGWEDAQPALPPDLSAVTWQFGLPDPSHGVDFYGTVQNEPNLVAYGYWYDPAEPPAYNLNFGALWDGQGWLDAARVYHQARLTTVITPGGSVTGVEHQCLTGSGEWAPRVISSAGDVLAAPHVALDAAARLVYGWPQTDGVHLTLLQDCQPQAPRRLPGGETWSRLAALALGATPSQVCALGAVGASGAAFELRCAPLPPP